MAVLSLALSLWLVAGAGATLNAELQTKLLAMGAEDQSVRQNIRATSPEGLNALKEKLAAVDSRNLAELDKIIEQFGWPGIDLVGVDASRAAFLILQHAPLARQQALLPLFRQAVAEGRARAADLALLQDRILVGEGKKQLYGSQVVAGPDGLPHLHPIEDPEKVDERRRAIGLPPLEEYLQRLEQTIGKHIERR
jgi:hypothetical protein